MFDFGDEWRVQLVVKERRPHAGEEMPQVLERRGSAPPQYPEDEEDGPWGGERAGQDSNLRPSGL